VFLDQGDEGKGREREEIAGRCALLLLIKPFVVLLYSSRGIPGKKCGSIILSAEELSNCRVSTNSPVPPASGCIVDTFRLFDIIKLLE
jgi:hypothetical protein